MSTNLISELLDGFQGDTLNTVASALGENPAKTQAALAGAIPAVIGSVANRASTVSDANSLLDLIRSSRFDTASFGDIASAAKAPNGISTLMNAGRPLMNTVFAGQTSSVSDWVSSLGGISRSSSSSLLALVVPLVLGQLGRRVSSGGWNTSTLMTLLSGQRSFIQQGPSGLVSLLGKSYPAPGVREITATQIPPRAAVPAYASPRKSGMAWSWVLPLLLLIPLLGYLLLRQPATQAALSQAPVGLAGAVDSARAVGTSFVSAANSALGPLMDRRLPSGLSLKIPANGVESKLVAYLEDGARPIDPVTRFSFDRLEFDTDSARLTPTSSEQLKNVAEILKAYPKATIKIGGYTDNSADAAHNLALSRQRATTTMTALADLGINRSRMQAEGYGEEHPIADNSTAEGRQRNRRIDINVTSK